MNHLPRLILAACLLFLSGCFRASEPDQCSSDTIEGKVLAYTEDHYLWNTELPVIPDATAYDSPSDLLDALTAGPRADGRDRYFSYMTTLTEANSYFSEGQTVGYGFGLDELGSGLFVLQVFPGSGAAAAGMIRGDEILAIAGTPSGLDAPAAQTPAILAAGTLSSILQSGTKGTMRHFRLRKVQGGATVDVHATTSEYNLDPVPGPPVILDVGNGHKVGYVLLRTFISPAENQLRSVFTRFKIAGVTDVIVDLRYNGGGQVSTTEVFLNLLHPVQNSTTVMYEMRNNAKDSASDKKAYFRAERDAVAPGKLAFIVSGRSASASELMVNALQPYLGQNLALVGSRTYGKPVGQRGYYEWQGSTEHADGCDWLLMLISFQIVNSEGTGGYFQGLPDADFEGVSCSAEDDLTHAPGDPAETCTAVALQWILDGTTPGPIPEAFRAEATSTRVPQSKQVVPQPELSLAQRHIQGLQ